MKSKILHEIRLLSIALINDTYLSEYQSILSNIQQYFHDLVDFPSFGYDDKHKLPVSAKTGIAIGLYHAANCLIDYKRTTFLLRGLIRAINDELKKSPRESIKIFYVGSGPFAPFVTLVAPLFKQNEIQFSLLEINQESLNTARKLIQKLELSEYVTNYYHGDAVSFKVPSSKSYHILFNETLNSLLERESYLPILWNMLPQFKKQVILIPEHVSLIINLKTNKKIKTESYIGTIIDSTKDIKFLSKNILPEQLPPKIITLKNNQLYKSIIIDTKVKIYKNIALKRGESLITLPYEIKLPTSSNFHKIIFTYQFSPEIKLKYKFG